MTTLCELTVRELGDALSARTCTSEEATRGCLERVAEHDDTLGAFLYVDREGALEGARRADVRRRDGSSRSPLDGVPLAVKDIFMMKGVPTSCASKILEGYIPPYDATVVRRLQSAGAVILGKLNQDEFAMGSSNENSAFKTACNPWDRSRVPGGSSGGSAVAVAAGQAFASLGTDTGGSIRQPAAFCGIVGLKPTYGRVSRFGVIAFASSLDQVGPMAKDVRDCATLFHAIAGLDPLDSTSVERTVPRLDDIEGGVKGMRIGLPKEYFAEGIDPEIIAALEVAKKTLAEAGAIFVDVDLPHSRYGIATYYLIATSEASSNLARYDGVRYGVRKDPGGGLADMYAETRGAGFGLEVKRRIMLGTFALSAGYADQYYSKAQRVRTLICRDFDAAFERCDAMLTPATPTPAFERGAKRDDPVEMYLSDVFTVGANLAGIPGLALPSGFNGAGLPLGMQLLGPHWSEDRLLKIGRAFEREHDFSSRRPSL